MRRPKITLADPPAIGQRPPDFTLPSTAGGVVRLADLLGQGTVVLAFFPKAFTFG